MKRDGRTLDHATLETIRLMAVERVLEGEVASAVITSYGFNRTTTISGSQRRPKVWDLKRGWPLGGRAA